MKILGANKFVKMDSGTFFVRHWMNSRIECLQLIEEITKCPHEYLNNINMDLHIYMDNSGSMSFLFDEQEETSDMLEKYIFYYDMNIVGDAMPWDTFYVVLDESELPNELRVEDANYSKDIRTVKKEDILKIRDIFMGYKGGEKNDYNKWAFKELEKMSKEDNFLNLEIEVR